MMSYYAVQETLMANTAAISLSLNKSTTTIHFYLKGILKNTSIKTYGHMEIIDYMTLCARNVWRNGLDRHRKRS